MMPRDLRQFKYARPTSEQIRLTLGLLTVAERAALEKRATERAAQEAMAATKGVPLFGEEPQ